MANYRSRLDEVVGKVPAIRGIAVPAYKGAAGAITGVLDKIGDVTQEIDIPVTTIRHNSLEGFYKALEKAYGLTIMEVPYAELIRIAKKPAVGYRTQLGDVYVAVDYMGRMLTDKEKAAIAAHEAGHDMTKPDDEIIAEKRGRDIILEAYGHDSVTLDEFDKMHERSMN